MELTRRSFLKIAGLGAAAPLTAISKTVIARAPPVPLAEGTQGYVRLRQRWLGYEALDPFGARVASTIYDDAAPVLQRALDALPDTGGTVNLANGTFRVARPVTVTRDHTHLGNGGLRATHSGPILRVEDETRGTYLFDTHLENGGPAVQIPLTDEDP